MSQSKPRPFPREPHGMKNIALTQDELKRLFIYEWQILNGEQPDYDDEFDRDFDYLHNKRERLEYIVRKGKIFDGNYYDTMKPYLEIQMSASREAKIIERLFKSPTGSDEDDSNDSYEDDSDDERIPYSLADEDFLDTIPPRDW